MSDQAIEDIGRRAVAAGLLSEDERAAAERVRVERGMSLEDALEELGLLTEDQVVALNAAASGLQAVFPYARTSDRALVGVVPADLLRRFDALPLAHEDAGLVVAFADPADAAAIRAIESAVGCPVRAVLAGRHRVRRVLSELLGPAARSQPERAADSAALALFYGHLARALDARADELRFDVVGDELLVRCRVGARLMPLTRAPATMHLAVAARALTLLGKPAASGLTDVSGLVTVNVAGKDALLDVTITGGPRDGVVLVRIGAPGGGEPDLSERTRADLARVGSQGRGLVLVVSDDSVRAIVVSLVALGTSITERAVVCTVRRPHPSEPSIQHLDHDPQAALVARALRRRPDVIIIEAGTLDGPSPDALAAAAREALVVALVRERDPFAALALLVEGAALTGALGRALVALVEAQPRRPVSVLEPGPELRSAVEARATAATLRAVAEGERTWT